MNGIAAFFKPMASNATARGSSTGCGGPKTPLTTPSTFPAHKTIVKAKNSH
jgi:hypothetical protein